MSAPVPALNPVYARQQALNLTIPRRVSIIGCGGVGSWTALFLALAGVPELHLWDSDEVSETNLNRLPLGPHSLGLNKAGALKLYIEQIVPRCSCYAMSRNWSPEDCGEVIPTWIIAATDSHASRQALHRWSQGRCRYVEVSAEGETGGCTDSPALLTSDLELQRGYQSVPVWVGPCVSAAMMACSVILHTDSHAPTFNYHLGFTPDTSVHEAGEIELLNLR